MYRGGKNREKQGENKAAVIVGGVSVAWMRVAVVGMKTRGQSQDVFMVELTIGLTDGKEEMRNQEQQ